MTVSTPSEAVKYFGYLATKGGISGIIIMVGEWVVEIHETANGFNTTHIAYPFEVEGVKEEEVCVK